MNIINISLTLCEMLVSAALFWSDKSLNKTESNL